MFALLMLVGIGANVYYAFQPDTFLPPWAHVLGAVFCFMGLFNELNDRT